MMLRLEMKVRWLHWTPMMVEMERLVVHDDIVDVQNRLSGRKLNVILISQAGVLYGRR